MKTINFVDIPISEAVPDKKYCGYKYIDAQGQIKVQLADISVDKNKKILLNGLYPLANDTVVSLISKTNTTERNQIIDSFINFEKGNFKINLLSLHHNLYDVGEATQDRWHVWLSDDWKKMLYNLEKQNYLLVGFAPSPSFSGSAQIPLAIVYEEKDSNKRFWQHIEKDWVEKIRNESKETYELIKQSEC